MIANLTKGAKTASLHLPADRFQIAGVLSYRELSAPDENILKEDNAVLITVNR